MFQTTLTDLKLTQEMTRLSQQFVFQCEVCYRRGSVHRCSVCKCRWYCGLECQNEDWKVVHKDICQMLKKKGKKRANTEKRKKQAEEITENNNIAYKEKLGEMMKSLVT